MVASIQSVLAFSLFQTVTSWIIPTTRTHLPASIHQIAKCSSRRLSPLYSTPQEMGRLQNQISSMGLNELQTQFRLAVARQDIDAAILYRDELAERVSGGAYKPSDEESDDKKKARLSWEGLGTAPWLIERLDTLEFPLPTTIQINAFEAVNTILENHVTLTGQMVRSDDTLEERMEGKSPPNMGVVISGSTGSGKTLAFLVPTLSTLSQSLFVRERIRLKAEEDVGDVMGDLLDRVMVQASPTVMKPGYQQIGGQKGRVALTGAAMASLGKSGTDVKSPICLIVVPSRELGVQIALQMYELVGGNVKSSAKERSGLKNFLRYKGPKGVKIGCVLDDEMSKEGLKLQTDVAITTPKYLTKLLEDGDVKPDKLRAVIFDEADLGLEQTKPEDLQLLFDNDSSREFSRLSYLVGASVTESLGNLAVKDSILPEGNSFIATATKFGPLTKDAAVESEPDEDKPFLASLNDLNLCLDPGLRHERVIAPDGTALLTLARLVRQEIRDYENSDKSTESSGVSDERLRELELLRQETNELVDEGRTSNMFKLSNAETISTNQRPRVVIFFPDEDTARNNTSLLRDALWGDHKIGVLLPDTGIGPLEIMEKFKKNDLSVLLATPNSIRGLDFPALTHVYTLFLPADEREYLHLAGRVGRIGQQGAVRGQGGKVTTIIDPEDSPKYEKMASFLGFEFTDIEPPQPEGYGRDVDVDEARRNLEDLLMLNTKVPDRIVNEASLLEPFNQEDYADLIDDDEDYDDNVYDSEIYGPET
ncbi:hypothetical protein ACHAWO_004116 [Cyclotella atomus]|uniref:ATP-dependent RNA helicase n=1 Tax=Cyclotella atomus TaxID=382360 RepID=A0ABD3NAT5_9STRA